MLLLLFGQPVKWHSHKFGQIVSSCSFLIFGRPTSVQRFSLRQFISFSLVSDILKGSFKSGKTKKRTPSLRVDDSVEKEPQEDGNAGRHDLLDHDVKVENSAEEHKVPEKDEEGQ